MAELWKVSACFLSSQHFLIVWWSLCTSRRWEDKDQGVVPLSPNIDEMCPWHRPSLWFFWGVQSVKFDNSFGGSCFTSCASVWLPPVFVLAALCWCHCISHDQNIEIYQWPLLRDKELFRGDSMNSWRVSVLYVCVSHGFGNTLLVTIGDSYMCVAIPRNESQVVECALAVLSPGPIRSKSAVFHELFFALFSSWKWFLNGSSCVSNASPHWILSIAHGPPSFLLLVFN